MRVMHDGVKNRYFFDMNGRPITLVSLTPKQIYEEQMKLKKEKMVEKENLYINRPSLLTRFFLVSMMMLFFYLVLIY
jgi:hypothetical protein